MKRSMLKILAALGLAVALSGCIVDPWYGDHRDGGGYHEGGGYGGGGWHHNDHD